jgi:signal transduction histidine kinase
VNLLVGFRVIVDLLAALLVGTALVLAIDAVWRRVSPLVNRRRKHPPRGRVFRAFFGACLALLVIWLGSGIAPYFAHRSPSWHRAAHGAGGALNEHTVVVKNHDFDRALERLGDRLPHVDPAAAEFDHAELTVRAGTPTRILLENHTVDPHSISIYADPGYRDQVFAGEVSLGPRRLSFDADGKRIPDRDEHEVDIQPTVSTVTLPRAGTYWFRCGVFANMTFGRVSVGRVTALAPGVGPTHERIGAPTWAPWKLAYLIAEESHRAQSGAGVAADYAFSMLNVVLAVFLMRLKPRDRVARLFALGMLATAAAYNLQSHSAPAIAPLMGSIHPGIIHPLSGLAYVYALLLFPDGRLVPRWRDRRLRIMYGVGTFLAVAILLEVVQVTKPAPQVGHAVNFLQFFGVLVPLVAFASQGYRLRRADTAEERQQSRLLLFALAPVLLVGATLVSLDATIGLDDTLVFRAFQPVFALIPVALFIGIVRYRLWDIDLVVSKTILFGVLAVFIGAVYVSGVVGIGQALPAEASVPLQIGTMVIIAVAFEPVRERAGRLANRLVYGERASPYEVMADFSHRLAGVFSVEQTLPRTAEAAARGLGAAYVRVRVSLPDGGERSAEWPEGTTGGNFDRVLDVAFRGSTIGEIAVAKPTGESFTAAEDRLLAALAGQTGLAFHSVRLSHDLRVRLEEISVQTAEITASRGRILDAQVAERRRLEEEISEAISTPLGRTLDSLDQAAAALPGGRARAVELLESVALQAVAAQDRLRDIARGVFPPLLADKGLVPAIEGQVRKLAIPATLDGRAALAGVRFDSEAETAVYFCCAQAMRSAARAGGEVRVELAFDGTAIRFSVAHHGPPPDDLAALADRVEALGGSLEVRAATGRGTTISAVVPARPVTEETGAA